MLAVPVIAGVAVFGLLASWGTFSSNDDEAPTIVEDRPNASQTYNTPVPDGNSNDSVALLSSPDIPAATYLEERVGGSEYTLLEDNRTLVGN